MSTEAPAWKDVIRRVGTLEEECIEVGQGDSGLGIEIRCPDDKSKEYWGNVRFTMSRELAKALGEILIEASQDEVTT